MTSWNFIRRSLRWKITLGLILPVVAILILFTYLDYSRLYSSMLRELSIVAAQSGQLIEQNVRQQMVKMDFVAMQQMLDTVSDSQHFHAIYLLDRDGNVIFSPSGKGVGLRLNNAQVDCQPCHHLPPEKRPPSVIVDLAGQVRVFRTMQAIKNGPTCVKCHDPSQPIIGLLLIDVPTAPFESSVNDQLREHLFWWLGTVITLLLTINLTLSRFVLQRLENYSTVLMHSDKSQAMPVLEVKSEDELGRLAQAFNTMSRQVELRQAENLALSEDLRRQVAQRSELLKYTIHAQEDERRRVAREIHDEFGTSLGGLALQTEAVRRFLDSDPQRAKDLLQQIKNLIVDTTNRMYELILRLRPSVLDDLGFAVAVRSMAEKALEKAGIAYEIDDHQFVGRLPKELETPLYRIFQEAINNIVRHSSATAVVIRITRDSAVFEGLIQDNGVGFDLNAIQLNGDDSRGLGLLGMQERTAQCGGSIHIHSKPGSGTAIMLQIPLRGFVND